jgi:hypothetical protein
MSIEEMMGDSRLVELCELQRIGDEVLDVISLTENQHSDTLAWMLDSKEGHGQGDEILRDLLISASTAAREQRSLDRKSETAKFFKNWPASRIRTTSFGAAFAARELGIKAAERVDLFVIDAQNSFVLVIENKVRGGHGNPQLNLYREKFNALVAGNGRLKKYDYAFIAVDRDFDVDADEDSKAGLPEAATWLHLGYEWLKTSAERARMHVGRGNAAAKLVVSYCNRQTDWENPDNKKATDIALQLHQRYPEAVKDLLKFSGGRLEREWLQTTTEDAAFLFLLQNKGVAGLLKETRGMAVVQAAILSALPTLPRDSIEHKRVSLDLCPRGWEKFKEEEGLWPVFLNVRAVGEAESRYTLALCCNTNHVASEQVAVELRDRLIRVDARFRKFGESKWRRVVVARSVTLQEVVNAVVDIETRLVQALN